MTLGPTPVLSPPEADAGYAPVGGFSARVLDGLGEALLERAGLSLRDLVGGLATVADVVDAGTTATGPGGWPAFADLDATPWPRTLAILVGAEIPTNATPSEVRDLIRGWSRIRGTLTQLQAAADAAAPGLRVDILERHGSPWRFTVRLYAAEATEADRAAVQAALEPLKPVGLVMTVALAGATYAHLAAEHGPTYADDTTTWATAGEQAGHAPEEGTIP